MSRNEKRRMGIYVVTGIVLVAVVAVLSVAMLKKRDSKMPIPGSKSVLYG